MDQELAEIYQQLSEQITPEEFETRIAEKVSLMGGLCDRRTAAMLVARELGAGEVLVKIARIMPESGMVAFTGKVVTISEIREFKRADGSAGRVANITLGDETGTIRAVLWDEATNMVKSGDIEIDQCLKVRGTAKEGIAGTEVTIGRNGGLEMADADIKLRLKPFKISEIKRDMSGLNLVACVLDAGDIREFVRKDGSKGQVRTVLLGDDTGKIRLNLWNELARMDISPGESLEILGGSTRERYGQVEIQTGGFTTVKKSNAKVNYQEKITPIDQLEPGMICTITGFVTGLGEVREFQRNDGTPGQVANIYISDVTGRIKAALWGDHVRLIEGLDIGFLARIEDCQVKSGWNEELEVSCGWRTKITFTPPEQLN